MRGEFQFCKMNRFRRLLARQGEYTYHDRTVHLKTVKMVNFMLCILYNCVRFPPLILEVRGKIGTKDALKRICSRYAENKE